MSVLETLTPDQIVKIGKLLTRYLGSSARPGFIKTGSAVKADMLFEESHKFGSGAVAGTDALRNFAFKDYAGLLQRYNAHQGERDASGAYLGGTGATTINSEPQKYPAAFGPDTHAWEADALVLKGKVYGGSYGIVLIGDLAATAATGITATRTNTVPTPIADIGITAAQLSLVKIGMVANSPIGGSGWLYVYAIDTTAGAETITFRKINGADGAGYKGNWHITFHSFFYWPIASSSSTSGSTQSALQFDTAIPAPIVVGMTVQGSANGGKLQASAAVKISAISSDRKTVTFDGPVRFEAELLGSRGDGVWFQPGLFSGQICARNAFGPKRKGIKATYVELKCTLTASPKPTVVKYPYRRSDVLDILNGNPAGIYYGPWPAWWAYAARMLLDDNDIMIGLQAIAGAPFKWNELDFLELFFYAGGAHGWTGNLHRFPFTREKNLQLSNEFGDNSALAPPPAIAGSWVTGAASNMSQTPDSTEFVFDQPLARGTPITLGCWTDEKEVVHYVHDVALCASKWTGANAYVWQVLINLAFGSFSEGRSGQLFYPHTNAMAETFFFKVHEQNFFSARM